MGEAVGVGVVGVGVVGVGMGGDGWGWVRMGGDGWVGVVGGCERTALSASTCGSHSAKYNSRNSVAGKRQAER